MGWFSQFKNQTKFHVRFYYHNEEVNENIREFISEIFLDVGKEDFIDPIYSCVKELVVNATKANLKRVFFLENHLDINNMGEYVNGLIEFKEMLEKQEYEKYEKILKEHDLWVEFRVNWHKNAIVFEVMNNSEIIAIEEYRVRMKLKLAMEYTDLAQYYAEQMDTTEGAGLGIALVVLLLRGMGLDPSLFRIGSKHGVTIARIEIPLVDEYVSPLRKKE
ncbi:hypothetical protein [Thermospira aquatica]|uniref:ATP-binding protein n=1 Tax=Thermospira aquatica TaxID=2828656 RepID=A0AAX3BE17_9SPIR|nr:hypothetical protein [Thermospira aquatica]URA09976.1 ATP-binding protein [Thermospira aquatica]